MNIRKPDILTLGEHAALNEIKTHLEDLFPVERFVLFGSKARGDDHEFSDIDLLVVIGATIASADKRKISDTVFEVNLKHGTQFSILSVASADFHSDIWSRLPIFRIIAAEGVLV